MSETGTEFEICRPTRAFYNKKGRLVFDPPVYRQRYGQMFAILLGKNWRSKIKKVADFGCAEFATFITLKKLLSVHQISFVDIDDLLLRDKLFKLRPLNIEYLSKRSNPLKVEVFAGSAGDPDIRLQDTDVVLAIELIEHLYPDVLELLPYNIFSYIRPMLFIVTTPNVEFNVLFSEVGGPSREFRHADHKFEWSREQFESWALNLTSRYPEYEVEFIGIGGAPIGKESHGHCSQMAVFKKLTVSEPECVCDDRLAQSNHSENDFCTCGCRNCVPKRAFGVCTYYTCSKYPASISNPTDTDECYELIETIDYPYEIDERSELQVMTDTVKYKINSHIYRSSFYYNEETDRVEIPLSILIYDGTHEQMLSISELRNILLDLNYKIESCVQTGYGESELCVVCCINDPDSSSSESEQKSDEESKVIYTIVAEDSESDWDA